ncbi:MAG TPA: hypothetical protein VJ804_12030 [Acidimicrobiales bacterium]|nr:hypothetical protein [Acidimicrobiales bacterium]
MDLSKLSRTDRIIAVSGLVLFVSAFLPWFKAEFAGFSDTGNGWDVSFVFGGLPALLGLLSAGVVLATKLGNATMPDMPFSTGQAMLGVGGLAALLVVLKLLIGEDSPGFGVDVSRSWGLFVATIAALALAGGGYLAFQEEKSGTASGPSF